MYSQAIKALVNGGVDPYMRDVDGLIPADLAEQCDHMQCANYLRAISKYVSNMEMRKDISLKLRYSIEM